MAWVTDMLLETKLATSVSKLLGVTPLVSTLDKARKALHKKENFQNRYHHNNYEDTLASVQTQVLATHQKHTKEIEKWERDGNLLSMHQLKRKWLL